MSDRPEPFATVLELIDDYSVEKVLEAISDNAELDSQDKKLSDESRGYASRLYRELEGVLVRIAAE